MIEFKAGDSASIKLTRNKVFSWHRANGVYAKGYLFSPDGALYKDEALCAYFSDVSGEDDFKKKLCTGNGLFSVIIIKKDFLWIAVDRFRYFPLYYRMQNGVCFIGDEVDHLFLPGENRALDEEGNLTYSGLSYALANKTLLKGVWQVQAGEFVKFFQNQYAAMFYHRFLSEIKSISFEDAKVRLKEILNNIAARMSLLTGDRQVVLSLSGGLDSRLLAYFLKKTGKENVLCYTFGRKKGNPEWKYSKEVADRLGFEWLFVDYTSIESTDFYKQKQFIDFYTYESQYVSKFGFMQYFAADYLINHSKIQRNGVMLQGHGGDFFSGSHLRPYMQNYKSTRTVAKDLQYIHCNIVELNGKERRKIRSVIKNELVDEKNIPLFCNVENWDLKERQAKYIINTNKLWEQFGVEVQMPLCDIELMDFYVSLPFEYRLNQKLYKTVLWELFEEYNLNFQKDKNTQPANPLAENVKVRLKRIFPFWRKKDAVFRYDYFDYERLVQPIMNELKKGKKNILSMNGVFSEWYLMQVKKEID